MLLTTPQIVLRANTKHVHIPKGFPILAGGKRSVTSGILMRRSCSFPLVPSLCPSGYERCCDSEGVAVIELDVGGADVTDLLYLPATGLASRLEIADQLRTKRERTDE